MVVWKMIQKLNYSTGKNLYLYFDYIQFYSFFIFSSSFYFSGLSNNSDLETFNLRYTLDDRSMIPVRYVRLEPLESWGSNFNYSLWYVELHGIDDPHVVSKEITKFYQVRFKIILLLASTFNYDCTYLLLLAT